MQRIVVLALVLIIGLLSQCSARRKAERTSTGRAAYGLAVSSGGKVRKARKSRRDPFKVKSRKPKLTPEYRKKDPWAG